MKQMILKMLPSNIYLPLKRWSDKRSCKNNFKKFQIMRVSVTEQGYSFKEFDVKKAIFIHIPKCAGISINQSLFSNLGGGHTTLEEYLNIFEPHCINSYFKFTIVRNPWDRLVSAYYFLKRGGLGKDDLDWFNKELNSYSDFNDFVKRWLNKKNIWKWHHFRPQYYYILDKKGKVPINFVGFFENLDDDFKYITKKIGVVCDLIRSNESKHKNYQDYYSDETRGIVQDVYSEDIKMLGYNFSNTNLNEQLIRRCIRKK